MPFSKTFPKTTDKSVYPKWIEIYLTPEEERAVESDTRLENVNMMKECLDDAINLMRDKKLHPNMPEVVRIAQSLFEKRASHQVFSKEEKCKEKFDESQKEK
jgi:hypothetical protein